MTSGVFGTSSSVHRRLAPGLAADDLRWLLDHVDEVRAHVLALDSPLGHGVVHGDAWAGNVL
jgi:hypothetical protein